MLHNAAIVRAVASTFVEFYPSPSKRPALVVDPVMVSTSGHELLEPAAEEALCTDLMPLATLVTPNLPEAIILAGWKGTRTISNEDDMRAACEAIAQRGGRNVLLKGGHSSEGDTVKDILYESGARRFTTFEHKYVITRCLKHALLTDRRRRVDTKNSHGTGCTLSAALTAFLAQGSSRKRSLFFAAQRHH